MTDPSHHNGRVFWSAAVTVIVLDVVTKWIVTHTLTQHYPKRIIGDAVRFTLAYNPGAAFSMSIGDYNRIIFGGFAIVALVILYRLYKSGKPGETAKVLALGLAWGGAAGNLIDRFFSQRGVIDFIDVGTPTIRFWTFNVADSAVTVGAILLALVLWREDRERAQPPPA